jgi:hypothetical protein
MFKSVKGQIPRVGAVLALHGLTGEVRVSAEVRMFPLVCVQRHAIGVDGGDHNILNRLAAYHVKAMSVRHRCGWSCGMVPLNAVEVFVTGARREKGRLGS